MTPYRENENPMNPDIEARLKRLEENKVVEHQANSGLQTAPYDLNDLRARRAVTPDTLVDELLDLLEVDDPCQWDNCPKRLTEQERSALADLFKAHRKR